MTMETPARPTASPRYCTTRYRKPDSVGILELLKPRHRASAAAGTRKDVDPWISNGSLAEHPRCFHLPQSKACHGTDWNPDDSGAYTWSKLYRLGESVGTGIELEGKLGTTTTSPMTTAIYELKYSHSHALVIGINSYDHAPGLAHARNDAEAFAQVLLDSFQFSKENLKILTNTNATKSKILNAFMKYAQDDNVVTDDRIVVFFAGHGHTVAGRRGETGFLVPVDGDPGDLSTLIRWDDLTRNADLIPAKHMLFVMDACYGGLALTRRTVQAGSMRFLRDMLRRYSRQVLTAGKADETVADASGPRAGHSLFTGHLLDALEGGATTEKVITASGVMAYVYQKVARDQYSQQTPHYGFLDGDGDFIFAADALVDADDGEMVTDVPITVIDPSSVQLPPRETVVETLKQLLSTPSEKIRLDDFVSMHIRATLEATNLERFPVQGVDVTNETFASRIAAYEEALPNLATVAVLMGRWCTAEQLPILEKMFTRLAEDDRGSNGTVLWLNLGWYPTMYLMYAAGIAALSADNCTALARILTSPVHAEPHEESEMQPLVVPVIRHLTEIVDAFKGLPGHDRHYVARSEHLRTQQQSLIEDLLLLGRGYDQYFDRFEMLLALTYADATDYEWGPPGRFAWKHCSHIRRSPYVALIEEATRMGDNWPPVEAGLFRGSTKRFLEVADKYKRLLDRLGWW